MKLVSALLFILGVSGSLSITASPLEDLASPDQGIRDKAAEEQRRIFKSTPESKWTPIIENIIEGESKKDILELFKKYNVTRDADCGSAGGGGGYSDPYRLDDEWRLICWFTTEGDKLIDKKLIYSMRAPKVLLPPDYTGLAVFYFVNGRKCAEGNLKDGLPAGEYISYYPSGNVASRKNFQAGKLVGISTWYDENGNVTSTENLPLPKTPFK